MSDVLNLDLKKFSDLDLLWDKFFAEYTVSVSAKMDRNTDFIHSALKFLDTERGLILKIPDGDWDIAFSVNMVCLLDKSMIHKKFKERVTPVYGCRDGWCVGTRLYIGPMVFLRKSLLNQVNAFVGCPLSKKMKKSKKVERGIYMRMDNAFRGPVWNPILFKEVKPDLKCTCVNNIGFNEDQFFDMTWMPPRIEFLSVTDSGPDLLDPILCSPLVPTSAMDKWVIIKRWGLVSDKKLMVEKLQKD